MVDKTCWYSLEMSFREELKYDIVILISVDMISFVWVRIYTDSDCKVLRMKYLQTDAGDEFNLMVWWDEEDSMDNDTL